MPIYDFTCKNEKCSAFEEDIELLIQFGDTPPCAHCGTFLTKVFRAPAKPKVPHSSWSTWRIGLND